MESAEVLANEVDRRLCVAPMMDRTDRHFRFLMRIIAPQSWLYTEMVTTGALLHGDAERHLRFDVSEHPVALQLGGNDPRALAEAARLGERAGYDEINLNVGCPSDRVQDGCFGAALMLDAPRVAACVAAMRDAVAVPVTVKTRLGVDEHDSYDFICEFISTVAAAGCTTFVLHARKAWLKGLSPKQNREIPPLDYARVIAVARDFPELEIVINGGITELGVATSLAKELDGIMLGRAACNDPMLMARLNAAMYDAPVASREFILEAFLPYLEREIATGQKLRFMTRHLLGLFAGLPGGRHWRRVLGELPEGAAGIAALQRMLAVGMSRGGLDPRALAA
jgi:tRNA-dihydrouridine synthase A